MQQTAETIPSNPTYRLRLSRSVEDVYFGSKLIESVDWSGNVTVIRTDRLGTVLARGTTKYYYYPYGAERTATANEKEKFGTYERDTDGLDYADQRYYSSTYGRFLTADPYGGSAKGRNPRSWNRYAYVNNDPANATDPTGRVPCFESFALGPYCGSYKLDETDECVGFNLDLDCGEVSLEGNDCMFRGYGPSGGQGGGAGTPAQGGGAGSQPAGPQPSGAQFAGFDRAISALDNPECARLIAGIGGQSATQLKSDLNAAQVTVGTSAPGNTAVVIETQPDGDWFFSYQWGYASGGNIELNGNYFPDPTLQNIQVPGGTRSLLQLVNTSLNSNLTAQQFGTLVFLHELSHIADSGNRNVSTIDSAENNKAIISTCIK